MAKKQPALPANRAFVVQFRPAETHKSIAQAGRVEHMLSGQSTHFQTAEQLLAFIQHTLEQMGDRPP